MLSISEIVSPFADVRSKKMSDGLRADTTPASVPGSAGLISIPVPMRVTGSVTLALA